MTFSMVLLGYPLCSWLSIVRVKIYMVVFNKKNNYSGLNETVIEVPVKCRCGGKPSKPKAIENCQNRWIIRCQVNQCYAYNIGQGLADTIQGWNRLSTHFYR